MDLLLAASTKDYESSFQAHPGYRKMTVNNRQQESQEPQKGKRVGKSHADSENCTRETGPRDAITDIRKHKELMARKWIGFFSSSQVRKTSYSTNKVHRRRTHRKERRKKDDLEILALDHRAGNSKERRKRSFRSPVSGDGERVDRKDLNHAHRYERKSKRRSCE